MQDDILTSFSENCKRFFRFCSDFLHIFFSLRETISKTQDFVERKGWRTQIMRALRTDLALEAAEIFRQGQKSTARLEGILQSESLREGYAVTRTEIVDPAAARAIGKPAGRYVTVDLRPYFRRQGHFFGRGVRCLAAELRALLPPEHGTVLAVGLGNRGKNPSLISLRISLI